MIQELKYDYPFFLPDLVFSKSLQRANLCAAADRTATAPQRNMVNKWTRQGTPALCNPPPHRKVGILMEVLNHKGKLWCLSFLLIYSSEQVLICVWQAKDHKPQSKHFQLFVFLTLFVGFSKKSAFKMINSPFN